MDKYIGKMLDNRYEILEVIGTGGMAYVYKARCHRLNRLVAVKILKEEFAQDADFRRRFHAESHAVAMLSHPNIVAVYDVSRSSDVEYIIMELIDGITLKQYMQKKGQLNWKESLHFVSQIVKALSHAHGRGIIHRDIKPHNIMILRDGSVKVADFGIARFASVQNTLTQEALGSVHYISPEQARGSNIDARSDLYSAGVVLYEMLTSRLPFEGDSPVSVAIQHINSMPVSPRDINPEIPAALEVITMKAMSPKLSRRYSSAEAMLHDLEEFRKNPSISFDYDQSELMESASGPDEPTRSMKTGETRMVVARTEALANAREREEERKRVRREVEEEEDYRVKRSNSVVTVLTGVLAILLFIAGLGYLIISLFSVPDNQTKIEDIIVPKVIGRSLVEVRSAQDLPDLIFQESGEGKFSSQYAAGVIIEQDPLPNKSVKPGSTVYVVLSKGNESIVLENYATKDYRYVQSQLSNVGLKYDAIPIYEPSDTITNGCVIRTEPAGGSTVYKGDIIVLYVSHGKADTAKKVEMPTLTGKPEAEASQLLSYFNLKIGVPVSVINDSPAGTVVYQSIPAGTMVDEGTAVDINISLGPNPLESPSPSVSPSPSPSPTGDVTPSASPSAEPSPGTSSAPPEDAPVTVNLPILLPSDKTSVIVSIFVDGAALYEGVENCSQGTITRQITGMPTDIYEVRFDGVTMLTGTLASLSGR